MTTIHTKIVNLLKYFICSLFLLILVLPLSALEPEDFIGVWSWPGGRPFFIIGGIYEVEIKSDGPIYTFVITDPENRGNNKIIGKKRGQGYITWDYNEKGELISGTVGIRGYGFYGKIGGSKNAYELFILTMRDNPSLDDQLIIKSFRFYEHNYRKECYRQEAQILHNSWFTRHMQRKRS